MILASRIISALGITSHVTTSSDIFKRHTNFFKIWILYCSNHKGTFDATNLIFSNAYNSSYYAIPHNFREESKELIQGIIKPFGAIIGTFSSYLYQICLKIKFDIHIKYELDFPKRHMSVLISDLSKNIQYI